MLFEQAGDATAFSCIGFTSSEAIEAGGDIGGRRFSSATFHIGIEAVQEAGEDEEVLVVVHKGSGLQQVDA